MAMSGGFPTFFRDGKEYPGGLFLGGVVDAVHGNPRAEDEARTAHHLMVGGFVVEGAGLGTFIAGAVLTGHNASPQTQNAGLGLMLGGLVVEVVGLILVVNAPPHMYDAVNIYNDGIGAGVAAAPGSAVMSGSETPKIRAPVSADPLR